MGQRRVWDLGHSGKDAAMFFYTLFAHIQDAVSCCHFLLLLLLLLLQYPDSFYYFMNHISDCNTMFAFIVYLFFIQIQVKG